MTTTNPIINEQALAQDSTWVSACSEQDLVANSGVCVLLGKKQIAVFALSNYAGELSLYACDNFDPFGKANVMSRGILCSVGEAVCICSPLYKQHFNLLNGECIEQPDTSINVHPVKIDQGQVFLLVPANLAS